MDVASDKGCGFSTSSRESTSSGKAIDCVVHEGTGYHVFRFGWWDYLITQNRQRWLPPKCALSPPEFFTGSLTSSFERDSPPIVVFFMSLVGEQVCEGPIDSRPWAASFKFMADLVGKARAESATFVMTMVPFSTQAVSEMNRRLSSDIVDRGDGLFRAFKSHFDTQDLSALITVLPKESSS
jgi:hypothetical protein